MPYDINSQQVDIENLFKQNANDLSAIKELYRKLKDLEEKISQIKYVDATLTNKLKKEYENLKRIILDENIQVKLTNGINEINSSINKINNDINEVSSRLDTIETQKATKQEVDVERKRIDNIVSVNDSVDNLETVDIRVGFSGIKYDSAGSCVRNEDNYLYNQIDLISEKTNNLFDKDRILIGKQVITWNNGQNINNCLTDNADWSTLNTIDVSEGEKIYVLYDVNKITAFCNIFRADGTLSRVININTNGLDILKDEKMIIISCENSNIPNSNIIQVKKSDIDKFENFRKPFVTKEEKIFFQDSITDLRGNNFKKIFNIYKEGLYNTDDKQLYFENNSAYKCAMLEVVEGDFYRVDASTVSDYNFKAYAIFDENDNVLSANSTNILKNYEIEIPTNAKYLCVNSLVSDVNISISKFDKNRINEIEENVTNNKDKIESQEGFINTTIKRVVKAELNNPFVYSKFDKPYVTFCFDDSNTDLDKVASIFKEYDFPLCTGTPYDTMPIVCNGLSQPSNGFNVSMKIKDVLLKIVENGGEVLNHSWTPVTFENINSYNFMYDKFISSKESLTSLGFNIRGILLAGGNNALNGGTVSEGGDIMQYWSGLSYDYSDRYGITENYFSPRTYLAQTENSILNILQDTIDYKKWTRFFAHHLNNENGNLNEAMLRNVLQFCKDNDITVVTWSYIYDNYSSTELTEKIKNLI